MTIPVKKSQEARYNLNPEVFSFLGQKRCFWGRRPDEFAINEAQIGYILEFKLATGRDEWFLEVKEAEANEQHKSIIVALRAAAPKWKFEQNNFVVITVDLF